MAKMYTGAGLVVKVDGNCYQVLLTSREMDAVMALIKVLHGGAIRVLDEVIDGIALVKPAQPGEEGKHE